jgi:hypothetical protein
MSLEVISIGSDNMVRLDLLTNVSTGAYVNTATVTFTLTDANNNVLLSNVTMPYIAASNGRYEGTIPNATTATMAANALYTVAITSTAGAIILYRKLSCIAKYRSNL